MSRVNDRLGFIEPQLATLVDHPPQGEEWIHEVKHDGYRTQLIIEHGEARAYTRNVFEWSERYPGIIQAAAKLRCRSAILDGEVVVQDADGISDFEALNSAISWEPERLLFYAFDLLQFDGKDLREKCYSHPMQGVVSKLPHRSIAVDGARRGLRPSASRRAHWLLSGRIATVRQAPREPCWHGLMSAGSFMLVPPSLRCAEANERTYKPDSNACKLSVAQFPSCDCLMRVGSSQSSRSVCATLPGLSTCDMQRSRDSQNDDAASKRR
jgi:hypothetical protein